MTNLWLACEGEKYTKSLKHGVWRCVEDQGRSYTRKLVTSDAEHNILEELLDKKSKPTVKKSMKNLHYLLSTPFRYPPLRHGSRFGSTHEPSLFYASLEEHTTLAEKAFYRFFLQRTSSAKLECRINMTSFKANIDTSYGIDLTKKPFRKYTEQISSPETYYVSQKLGSDMRKSEIEAFIYYSARQPFSKNIGILSPDAFSRNTQLEKTFSHWNYFISKNSIEFSLKFSKHPTVVSFTEEYFFVKGKFPNLPGN